MPCIPVEHLEYVVRTYNDPNNRGQKLVHDIAQQALGGIPISNSGALRLTNGQATFALPKIPKQAEKQ